MTDEALNNEPGYRLVMPFVVCQSQGGPYEDAAFCAGVRFGEIMERIKHDRSALCCEPCSRFWYVEPALMPQLDLLAMDQGFVLDGGRLPEEDGDWCEVVFKETGPA